jgi:hypothetical protein
MRRVLGRRIVSFSFIPLLILVALVAVFGGSDNSTRAVEGGEGPLGPPFVHPNPGTTMGANLCQVGFTTKAPGAAPQLPDADYWDGTSSQGDRDFTGACDNNTTNAPGASPDYYSDMSIPAPHSNFSSNINASPPEATIAPGPGNPSFNSAVDPPLGAVVGATFSLPTKLALKIGAGAASPCNQSVIPEFTFMNATVDFSTIVSGTVSAATGGDPSTVTVNNVAGASLGDGLKITSGPGAGQGRYINNIAGNVITVDRPWEKVPVNGDTYEITNQVYPRTPGISNHTRPLSEDDPGNPGLPLHVTKFPSYLLEIIDPDLVHPRLVNNDPGGDGVHDELNGPEPPLTLRARYSGRQLVAGDDIELEFLVFEPGSIEAFQALDNHPWAQLKQHWGYITMTVLTDPTVPASPSAIQDFCTPLGTVTVLLGRALENQWANGAMTCTPVAGDVDDNNVDLSCPNTPPTDGTLAQCGVVDCGPRYTLPASGQGILGGNTHLYLSMTRTYRDTDNDGIEGYLDSCEGSADTWDDQYGGIGGPRVADQDPNDNLWDDDNDGLFRSCDPNDKVANPNQDEVTYVSGGTATGFTDFTLTDTSQSWAVNEHAGRTVVVAIPNQLRLINSNTATTLTVSQQWAPPTNPTPGVSYDIINEQFFNRQDNCATMENPSQFESESVPEVGGQPDYPEDGGPRTDIMGDVCEANDYVPDGHYHEDLNFYPHCISSDQATDDPDGDHWCSSEEVTFGSNPADVNSTPEHIYLDIAYALVRQQAGARPYVDKASNPALLGNDITPNWPAGLHPVSGMPVSGIARPCSNGFDDSNDGTVDRVDPNCRMAALTVPMINSLNNLYGTPGSVVIFSGTLDAVTVGPTDTDLRDTLFTGNLRYETIKMTSGAASGESRVITAHPRIIGTLDGVSVGATHTQLVDTLFTGDLTGGTIAMLSGAASGESRVITAHVGPIITVANFVGVPVAGDVYALRTTTITVANFSAAPAPGDSYDIYGAVGADTDGDGARDWDELLATTDPNGTGCANDTTPDNELKHYAGTVPPTGPPATVVAITDMNDDRTINILDVFKMFSSWLSQESDPAFFLYMADLNYDGTINILDVFKMFPAWLQSC